MDATNGSKLAQLFQLAGKMRILSLVLTTRRCLCARRCWRSNGYAEAFKALRDISGVVPSIMCMFGFNAGGGSYLPRQQLHYSTSQHLLWFDWTGRRQIRFG